MEDSPSGPPGPILPILPIHANPPDGAAVSDLRCLHEGTVTPDQIDHLGHMNVRFYATRAVAATRALAAEYGLDARACAERGVVLSVFDQYTRHYREQLEGARLGVMTGVLSVREEGLRLYHELVNLDSGELSASFVHVLGLQDRDTRRPRSFPAGLAERAQGAAVAWPEHGRPRSVDLERSGHALSLDEALDRGLAMRKPRRLARDECDADGFFQTERLQELVWGGEPLRSREGGWPLFETDDGMRVGWATLESRNRLMETPRVGTRIQSFGAEVAIASKTSTRHHWVFDLDRGRLLCASSIVNLAFDTVARRAIPIPDELRRRLEDELHPDLR